MIPVSLLLLMTEDETDRKFLEDLYARYHGLLYGQALLILRSSAAAEDAVSDCMLALTKKVSLLRAMPCNKWKAYAVITVKHQALNQLRRRKHEDVTADGEMEERAAPEETDGRLLSQAGVERIRDAILELPEREKQVLMMKYFRGLTDEEVAEELRLRPVTVRVTVSRARGHLAALLQRGENA